MKNILVLTGSPRYNGNTERLADAFIAGAREKGLDPEKIRLASLTINPCRDCEFCRTELRTCVHKDDMVPLLPKIEQADILVFVTPVYYYSWPSQMKLFFDRLFPYVGRPDLIAEKEVFLLASCADSTIKAFEGLRFIYQSCCKYWNWQDKGILLATNCFKPNDVVKNGSWIQQAQELGKTCQ